MTLKHIPLLVALPLAFTSIAQSLEGVKVVGPTETERFVTRVDGVEAPNGLEGTNIALWQSHGWYFEPKLNRWEWQRARIFQTVEDLYTQSYVMPFLMPMLENAGAYVMSPRERDVNKVEIIVDNDGGHALAGYAEHSSSHRWEAAPGNGFAYTNSTLKDDENPFRQGSARKVKTITDARHASSATWTADIPADGDYAVYVSYQTLPESANDARYTVKSARGNDKFIVNQRMGGGTWVYLGHFPLTKGRHEIVELTNLSDSANAVITADAVKIGGGMGNVARIVKQPLDDIDYKYTTSGYPRFTEGARYWLQWAGAPKSVYTESDNVNDYTDDYKCRGEWVNWLAGGSSMLPGAQGLNIPVDLSFAFHTDAGTTMDDTTIGTLGIYFTDGGKKYANGTERRASGVLTDMVMTAIVNDIKAQYEPNWNRRDMWDKSYYEARVPEVPAMLLELLSHQNFADMKYGLDPTFRFTVSRAIYKGMLNFLSQRDSIDAVVQPLPVRGMALSKTEGGYTLSWQPTEDKLEPTAMPAYYMVEERVGRGAFRRVAKVDTTYYNIKVNDDKIHSYRVIAGNDGGWSFPSEVLALCDKGHGKSPVLIVNGFTRVSGPEWFDSGDIAGFHSDLDGGVPYITDINTIGKQFEFRRAIPWMDDDACGFGGSRANLETEVVAGNTFDFVIDHGEAISQAGRGFVSMSLEAFCDTATAVTADVVDLILGKQKEIQVGTGHYGTKYKTFTPALQARLRSHCEAGGALFVTGSYIASDLWDNKYSTAEVMKADQEFAAKILGYNWRAGQASVTGEAYEVPCRFAGFTDGEFKYYNEPNSEGYLVESPDSFYPSDNKYGATFMRYRENNLIAGTAYDNGKWKTVAVGFPFESIRDRGHRANLMRQVLDFFAAPSRPPMVKQASAKQQNTPSAKAGKSKNKVKSAKSKSKKKR